MRLVLICAALVAFAVVLPPRSEPAAQVTRVSGDWQLASTRDGAAIFGAENVGPGGGASGSVTLTNTGADRGRLVLALSSSTGALAETMRLTVRDGSGVVVYDGTLATMPELALAVLEPGSEATYTFAATLPVATADAYQDTEATAGYRWTMVEPPVEPLPSPTQPPRPEAPAPAASPNPRCTVLGTPYDDRLQGTPGADVVCGRRGNDVLIGGDGDDELRGGDGDDRASGGDGDDLVAGGHGNDVLRGGAGDDLLAGGPGRERYAAGPGSNRIRH